MPQNYTGVYFPMYENFTQGHVSDERGGYRLIQLPKTGPTPAIGPPFSVPISGQPQPLIPNQPGNPPTTPGPSEAVGGFLDGSVAGIPIKYIVIGLAAWFFLKK